MREQRDKAIQDSEQQLTAVESERDNAVAKLGEEKDRADNLAAQIQGFQTARDNARNDADLASTEAAARVVESNVLNKEVQSLRDRIAELRQQLQVTEDQVLDLQGKQAGAKEVEEQLLDEVARLKDLLRLNDIDPRTPVSPGSVPEQIEKVYVFVKRSYRNITITQELVQITVGSDDRVYKDMILTIYRDDQFICQARVMKVYPDTAVCVVIESTRNRNGSIQEGDNVTTKL